MKKLFIPILCLSLLMVTSCNDSSQEKAKETAQKALSFSVGNTENLKIISVSSADSVIGNTYITQGESEKIMTHMMNVSEMLMKKTDNMKKINEKDVAVMDMVNRQMKANSDLSSLMSSGLFVQQIQESKELTAWKVKIDYEVTYPQMKDKSGNPFKQHNQRWCFLDIDGISVLKYIDIPIWE